MRQKHVSHTCVLQRLCDNVKLWTGITAKEKADAEAKTGQADDRIDTASTSSASSDASNAGSAQPPDTTCDVIVRKQAK